jgi:spore germination cell wall hydrolase CwlJ-like protein
MYQVLLGITMFIKKRFFLNKKKNMKQIYLYIAGGVGFMVLTTVILLLAGVFTVPSSDVMAANMSASPSPSVSITSVSVLPSEQNSETPAATSSSPSVSPSEEPSATPSPSPSPSKTTTKAAKPVDLDALVDKMFEVKADKYYNDFGYSSNTYNYTDNDIYTLAQLIYLEARGESYKGKLAVANVVMNRVLSRGYPGDTIKSVVSARNQFAYSSSVKPDSSCKRAARDVLAFEKWVIPQNVYFFKVSKSKDNWGSFKFYTKIGGHAFYEYNYYGRFRGDTIPPQLFQRIYRWPQFGCKPAPRVNKIQRMMRAFGYKIKADGYFGSDMKKAVQDFQKKQGLEADGVCGPGTIKAMIKRYGVDKFVKAFKK